MNHMKRIFALLMMLCLVLSIAVPAFADPQDNCLIRVYGGAQRPGLVLSEEVKRGEQYNLGEKLAGYLGTDVTGTKYYIRSTVRESGEEESVTSLAVDVNEDRDYVLTYGVKNNMVTYNVRYVDGSGNPVRDPSGPFVANKGDRVYVAYIEVTGYQPDAYHHNDHDHDRRWRRSCCSRRSCGECRRECRSRRERCE